MTHTDDDLDRLLQASGERWRTSQPSLQEMDVARLVRQRPPSRSIGLIGPVGALGAVALATVALAVLFLSGPFGSPNRTPTAPNASPTTGGRPNTLYLENRGGPAFTVTINDVPVTTVRCNDAVSLMPGQDELPQLPWDLVITRTGDGSSLVDQSVAALPRWFVQIGNSPIGISDNVVMGPMGPTCPPVSSPQSSSPSCALSDQLSVIRAVNEDRLNFGGVYLDHSGVLVIQYVGANGGRAAVERLIDCSDAVRWEKVERSRAELDRIHAEILERVQSGEQALSGVFAIGLDTIGNQIFVTVGTSSSLADANEVLGPAYGDAVRIEVGPPIRAL